MAVVSAFTIIVDDAPVTIGDGLKKWKQTFNIGGHNTNYPALLILNVRGLTYATTSVPVKINDVDVGYIHPYGGLTDAAKNDVAKYWYTQMIAVSGSQLNNGNNTIEIEAVGYPGFTDTDEYDDFSLKDMVCFFHKTV